MILKMIWCIEIFKKFENYFWKIINAIWFDLILEICQFILIFLDLVIYLRLKTIWKLKIFAAYLLNWKSYLPIRIFYLKKKTPRIIWFEICYRTWSHHLFFIKEINNLRKNNFFKKEMCPPPQPSEKTWKSLFFG